MSHSKSKIQKKDAQAFRQFLQARGVTCRDGKGPWQLFQVQAPGATGWKAFCFNAQDVVSGPAVFDDMAAVFNAKIEDLPEVVVDATAAGVMCHEIDLLDDFAIAAMPAIMERMMIERKDDDSNLSPLIAKLAYKVAKAMMAERAKHQPK